MDPNIGEEEFEQFEIRLTSKTKNGGALEAS